jgi:hypothetical protein
MPERRQTQRAACRLRCRIAKDREQLPARIVDVSEGGLCLISPVWLKPNEKYQISIDVPGTGLAEVCVEVWHIRRETSKRTNSRIWIAGAILVDADDAYAKLLKAAVVANPEADRPVKTSRNGTKGAGPINLPDPIDAIEPRIYRIRCKAVGGPRSRVLSLAADTEAQARSLAIRDLGEAWTVLEVRKA